MNRQPELQAAVPMLPAQNVAEGIAFYAEKLGFAETFRHGEPTDYAGVKRGDVELHLFACDDRHIAEWTAIRVRVTGIEALYEEYEARGVIHPNGKLETKPWGQKEFSVIDSSGVCLTFGEAAGGQ